MESVSDFIIRNADYAHWIVFLILLLAGFNIPICIDAVLIATAIVASTVIPEKVLYLYFSVFLGCVLSAWVAYWLGRVVGPKLCRWRYFKKILYPERLEKIKKFYENHGFLTLILGRFIPFGVRNLIFMSTGMSRLSFKKFVLRDLIACFLWSSCCFGAAYFLGKNFDVLWHYAKTFNLIIFAAFGVTVIATVWYKCKKAVQNSS